MSIDAEALRIRNLLLRKARKIEKVAHAAFGDPWNRVIWSGSVTNKRIAAPPRLG